MDFWLIFIMCVDIFFFPNLAYTLVIPVSAGGFGGLSPDGFCYNCMWIDRAYWLLKSSAAPVLWVICPWTCMLMAVGSARSEERLRWVDGVLLLQNRNNYVFLSILPHGCWRAQVPHSLVAQHKARFASLAQLWFLWRTKQLGWTAELNLKSKCLQWPAFVTSIWFLGTWAVLLHLKKWKWVVGWVEDFYR